MGKIRNPPASEPRIRELPSEEKGSSAVGGIDFNAEKLNIEVKNGSPIKDLGDENGIKFQMNPAQLFELQNAPGFTPIIINIQPMINLPLFLGLGESEMAISKVR